MDEARLDSTSYAARLGVSPQDEDTSKKANAGANDLMSISVQFRPR
jgi:hypothetical protein